jgi:hypothetical protein
MFMLKRGTQGGRPCVPVPVEFNGQGRPPLHKPCHNAVNLALLREG